MKAVCWRVLVSVMLTLMIASLPTAAEPDEQKQVEVLKELMGQPMSQWEKYHSDESRLPSARSRPPWRNQSVEDAMVMDWLSTDPRLGGTFTNYDMRRLWSDTWWERSGYPEPPPFCEITPARYSTGRLFLELSVSQE